MKNENETSAAGNDPAPTREMTYGEKLIGITFNPSADDKVAKTKRLCADLADLLEKTHYTGSSENNTMDETLFTHAIGQLLNAQMCAVKYLTNKF